MNEKPKQRRMADDALIIESVYQPDIERQMAALCLLLGIPYERPNPKRKDSNANSQPRKL